MGHEDHGGAPALWSDRIVAGAKRSIETAKQYAKDAAARARSSWSSLKERFMSGPPAISH